jgi:hypothetical protein
MAQQVSNAITCREMKCLELQQYRNLAAILQLVIFIKFYWSLKRILFSLIAMLALTLPICSRSGCNL